MRWAPPAGCGWWAATRRRPRAAADAAIDEVRRIEAKYSRYRDDSIVSRINAAAGSGRSVAVDDGDRRPARLRRRSCTRLSDGLFDITSGVLRRAWDFRAARLPRGGGAGRAAAADRLAAGALAATAHRAAARRHGARLRRLRQGVRGRPCAARCSPAPACRTASSTSAATSASSARAPTAALALRHPASAPRRGAIASVALAKARSPPAATTSATSSYDGRRYCHILDPRTGWPVQRLAVGQRGGAGLRRGRRAEHDRDAARAGRPRAAAAQGVGFLTIDPQGRICNETAA